MKRATAMFVLVVLIAAGLAAGVFAVGGAASTQAAAATSKVTVIATEFKFKLSKRSVPKGTVTFVLVNKGKLSHDFKIAGKKTPLIRPGKSAPLRITFKKKGRFAYLCTVAGHAAAGMKGVFTVTT
jgi:uncharacterized cupredoxin-like copper-binding protein